MKIDLLMNFLELTSDVGGCGLEAHHAAHYAILEEIIQQNFFPYRKMNFEIFGSKKRVRVSHVGHEIV